MSYGELQRQNDDIYQAGQKGQSAWDNLLSLVNLYSGQPAIPIHLASLSGIDQLSVSIQIFYQGSAVQQEAFRNHADALSVLGSQWNMALPRITRTNRDVKQGYDADYVMIAEGGSYSLYRNGEAKGVIEFFSIEQPLWKIYFHDGEESFWSILKEDGSQWIYGGDAHSVEIAADWDNWVGATAMKGGKPFPVSWLLREVSSYNDNAIRYEYENDMVLIGDVFCTRASRLKCVTSTFGECVKFFYGKKESFENKVSHLSETGVEAFQFYLETNYLERLEVFNAAGKRLYTQQLAYEFLSDEKNLLKKRFLKSVTQVSVNDISMSPLTLQYDQSRNANTYGNLSKITYPSGVSAEFGYAQKSMSSVETCTKLTLLDTSWKFNALTGGDFTVCQFSREHEIHLQVMYWDSAWNLFDDKSFAGESVKDATIYVGNSLFAVRYFLVSDQFYHVRLFKRNPVRRHCWEHLDLPLENETARPVMTCGRDFLAIQRTNSNVLEIHQFNYLDNQWHKNTLPVEALDFHALGAGNGFILGAYYNNVSKQVRLRTFFADANHCWKTGDTVERALSFNTKLTQPEFVWSIGPGHASATFVNIKDESTAQGNLLLMRWRDNFVIADTEDVKFQQSCDIANPILFSIVSGSMIGLAHHLFRFSPGGWNHRTLLTPEKGMEYRYAYGCDLALAVERKGSSQAFFALRFDPYLNEWVENGTPQTEAISGESSLFVPVIFGNYALLGREIFCRNPNEHWSSIGFLPDNTDGSTIQFDPEGEYLIGQDKCGSTSFLMTFEDDAIAAIQYFDDRLVADGKSKIAMTAAESILLWERTAGETPGRLGFYALDEKRYRESQNYIELSSATLDTGFEQQRFFFNYDAESMCKNKNHCCFSKVEVVPIDPSKCYGYTKYCYWNGRSPDDPAAEYPESGEFCNVREYYTHFAGQLYYKEVRDDADIPVTGGKSWYKALDVNGFVIRLTRTSQQTWLPAYKPAAGENSSNEHRLLEKIIDTQYEPEFYQQRRIIKYYTDAEGNRRQTQKEFTYVWEQYPQLLADNLISPVIQTKELASNGDVIKSQAMRWEYIDGKWLAQESYQWQGKAEPVFRFAQQQEGWAVTQKIIRRNRRALVSESSNELDIHTLTLYDKDDNFVVATFEDTRALPVVYCGFEPYEELRMWGAGELEFCDDECFSGTRSLALNNGKKALLQLGKLSNGGTYLLKYALKSDTDQGVIVIAAGTKSIEVAMPNTAGRWLTTTTTVNVSGLANPNEIIQPSLRFKGPLIGKILLDAIFFTPLCCVGTANVFTGEFNLKTAEHSNRTSGSLTLFDHRQRPVCTLYDDNRMRTCARYSHGDENRSRGDGMPDTTLCVELSSNNKYYALKRGMDFTEAWNISGEGTLKQRRFEILSAEATFCLNTSPAVNFILLMSLEHIGNSLNIQSGKFSVRKQGNDWRFEDDGKAVARITHQCEAATDMMLISIGARREFFIGGKSLFASSVAATNRDTLSVTLDRGTLLKGIGAADNPKISLSHVDYVGRLLQDQLITETGVITNAVVYSKLDQQSIITKKLEIPNVMWGYRASFITGFNSHTGVMQGEIADAFPADEGFPYTRSLTTTSPSPTAREFGACGKELAITESAENPRTVRLRQYESSGVDARIPGGMFVESVIDPADRENITVKDSLERTIATLIATPDGAKQLSTYTYDDCNLVSHIYHPQFYSASPDAKKHFSEIKYDPLGNITQRFDPDSGTTRTVYERNGRIRFLQDAQGAQESYYRYHCYDNIGREVESGMIASSWDDALLRKKANDLQWVGEGAAWKKRVVYDGDGTDSNLLGKLWKIQTQNDGIIVTEQFAYNNNGDIIFRQITLDSRVETIVADYDMAHRLTALKYNGTEAVNIEYSYDLQGRMRTVSWNGTPVCRYEYTADGMLAAEIFAPGQSEIRREYSYNAAQWLTKIEDPFFEENIDYNSANDIRKHAGQITRTQSMFSEAAQVSGNFLAHLEMNYTYDQFGRLAAVHAPDHPELSVGERIPFKYDQNSNLTEFDEIITSYEPTNNQLLTRSDSLSCRYNANGATTLWQQKTQLAFEYDPVMQNVTHINGTNWNKSFLHGANGICAYTQSEKGRTICLRDMKGALFSEIDGANINTFLLRGTNGIFAQVRQGKIYYHLKDRQSSVRGICCDGVLVAAYNYGVFGTFAGAVMESKSVAELISFRFTGQILEACGVYRMELRFYDPVSGRFLTIDPLLQYNSPYIYGGGDWVNYHDPDGAWSWESTLSIIFGFAMVVVGVALSVVSAGIASPVGAAFAYWGATAVIGGGIAATIYGITSGINNNFDKDDLFINMSMGALFAVIGGGAGALVPATIFNLSVAATSFIVDFGVGVIVGAADGIVSNGVLNVVHGQYFFDHALANGLIGGVMGGIFGGVCGIGRGFNTVKSMMLPAADSERASTLGIGFFNTSKGHSSIWNVDTMHGTHVGYGDAHGIDLSWWRKRSQRSKMACINVTDDLMDEIAPQVYLDVGEFHRCSNNCTNYVIRKLSNAEIYAPLWARTPLTLYWWGKLLGSFT